MTGVFSEAVDMNIVKFILGFKKMHGACSNFSNITNEIIMNIRLSMR